jgi:uncharacterized protein (DUF1697 family)
MAKYVALLRGINLGKRQIKMTELKALFEKQGYRDVKTLLASGNVIFSAKEDDAAKLRSKIEKAIKEKFRFDVPVILRSEKEINTLVKSDPFKGEKVEKNTRLFVTFLSHAPKASVKIPYKSPEGDYVIRLMTKDYVISILNLTHTTNAMDILKKEFGAEITTRKWNTVKKIHASLEGK